MNFHDANVKGIKADIAKGTITLSFEVDMNKDNLIMADELAPYTHKDSGYVDIEIHPHQLPLKEQGENAETEASQVINTDPGPWEQAHQEQGTDPAGPGPEDEYDGIEVDQDGTKDPEHTPEEESINNPAHLPEIDSEAQPA
jgi:hypothetical protein